MEYVVRNIRRGHCQIFGDLKIFDVYEVDATTIKHVAALQAYACTPDNRLLKVFFDMLERDEAKAITIQRKNEEVL